MRIEPVEKIYPTKKFHTKGTGLYGRKTEPTKSISTISSR